MNCFKLIIIRSNNTHDGLRAEDSSQYHFHLWRFLCSEAEGRPFRPNLAPWRSHNMAQYKFIKSYLNDCYYSHMPELHAVLGICIAHCLKSKGTYMPKSAVNIFEWHLFEKGKIPKADANYTSYLSQKKH